MGGEVEVLEGKKRDSPRAESTRVTEELGRGDKVRESGPLKRREGQEEDRWQSRSLEGKPQML